MMGTATTMTVSDCSTLFCAASVRTISQFLSVSLFVALKLALHDARAHAGNVTVFTELISGTVLEIYALNL